MSTPSLSEWKEWVKSLYRRRAPRYDLTANLYYLAGFREWSYRKRAVRALMLGAGDTVVELGCGTGLNFPLLRREVGPQGRIIGVDLSEEMLERARRRVERGGWDNVELVHEDMACFSYPEGVNGVLSTLAVSLVRGEELASVIRQGCRALASGGRMVILDLKISSNRSASWLAPFFIAATRPFGVTDDLARERPWDIIHAVMGEELTGTSVEEFYLGYVYLAQGMKGR